MKELMQWILLALALVVLFFFVAYSGLGTDATADAFRTLEGQGYTDIAPLYGEMRRMCGEDATEITFQANSPAGFPVKVSVCRNERRGKWIVTW